MIFRLIACKASAVRKRAIVERKGYQQILEEPERPSPIRHGLPASDATGPNDSGQILSPSKTQPPGGCRHQLGFLRAARLPANSHSSFLPTPHPRRLPANRHRSGSSSARTGAGNETTSISIGAPDRLLLDSAAQAETAQGTEKKTPAAHCPLHFPVH